MINPERNTPLLANCIAAHAVRFVDIPEVTKRGIMHVSDQYCDNAKVSSIRAAAMLRSTPIYTRSRLIPGSYPPGGYCS